MVRTLRVNNLLLLTLLLLAIIACRDIFRGEALASPSPSRLVVSEPSDAIF
jgi:hypothetical protein